MEETKTSPLSQGVIVRTEDGNGSPEPEVYKISGTEGVMLIPRPSDDPRDPLVYLYFE
jgi:hypothetical protein